jgi:uncharacterized protein YjdB
MLLGLTAVLMGCSGDAPTGPAERDPLAAVRSITIDPANAFLLAGDTLRLKVRVLNAFGHELANRSVAFRSSDDRVLLVDRTGLVWALAEGEATVTTTSEGKLGRSTLSVTRGGDDDSCRGCWDYLLAP